MGKVSLGVTLDRRIYTTEYLKRLHRALEKKVNFFEVPLDIFVSGSTINRDLLNEFKDVASSFNYGYTVHARDYFYIFEGEPSPSALREIETSIRFAEEIEAKSIVFHVRVMDTPYELPATDVKITIENPKWLSPFEVQKFAREAGVGFTLDVAHLFLYYISNARGVRDAYSHLSRLKPDHLHLSNTYLGRENTLFVILSMFSGRFKEAFARMAGDYHLPLNEGDIDYKKVFQRINIPPTITLELILPNYELLMKPKKVDLLEVYRKNISYLEKLMKQRKN